MPLHFQSPDTKNKGGQRKPGVTSINNLPSSISHQRILAKPEDTMTKNIQEKTQPAVKCPECRAPLKKRRTRNPDDCEMVCGGCGQMFDMCNLETVQMLTPQLHPKDGKNGVKKA